MKRIIFIMFMALTCHLSYSQDALFKKYEDIKGVNTVFISKSMLRLMPKMEAGDVDISKIASKLDRIQVLERERPSLIPAIKKEATAYYKKYQYEQIMRMNDGNEHTTIYQKSLGKGKNEFVLLNEESDELQIIHLSGSVSLNDIKAITD